MKIPFLFKFSSGIFLIISIFIKCSHYHIKDGKFQNLQYPENLEIIERAEWNWVPINSDFKTHKIKYITIHHGGVEFRENQNSIDHVRNLQSWSRSEKGWVDIPYHYMIDLKGLIYEARPINIPGDTNTEYDPTGHALIEVMGNYEIQELNEDQLNSMIDLIKFLSQEFNVPVEKIRTHRDYSEMTVCPGENIYKYFSEGVIQRSIKNSENN